MNEHSTSRRATVAIPPNCFSIAMHGRMVEDESLSEEELMEVLDAIAPILDAVQPILAADRAKGIEDFSEIREAIA